MKYKFCFLIQFLILPFCYAQEIVVDPVTSGAIIGRTVAINGQLGTNDKLNLIQTGQLAVTVQLLIVNDLLNKIYKGLSEVASVIAVN